MSMSMKSDKFSLQYINCFVRLEILISSSLIYTKIIFKNRSILLNCLYASTSIEETILLHFIAHHVNIIFWKVIETLLKYPLFCTSITTIIFILVVKIKHIQQMSHSMSACNPSAPWIKYPVHVFTKGLHCLH